MRVQARVNALGYPLVKPCCIGLIAAILFLAASVPEPIAAKQPPLDQYVITDLGLLPAEAMFPPEYSSSRAFSVNNRDQIVGAATVNRDNDHAVFWQPGSRLVPLGVPAETIYSSATAINDQGIIAGLVILAHDTGTQATIWQPGRGPLFLPRPNGTISSTVHSINASGQVVGEIYNGSTARPVLWPTTQRVEELVLPDGYADGMASSINDAGMIAGSVRSSDGSGRAIIWADQNFQLLATLGGNLDAAVAINNSGQAVGQINTGGTVHAALWENGGVTDLDTLGVGVSTAHAINNRKQVVGSAYGHTYSQAFLWQANTGMVDLNTVLPPNSGWYLTNANAISDSGRIVGSGQLDGREHAFLLTPAPRPLLITFRPLDPAIGIIRSYANGGLFVEFIPNPPADKLFLGWTINVTGKTLPQPAPGEVSTWANPFNFEPRNDSTISAIVVNRPIFSDVTAATTPYQEAITQLTTRQVIAGYTAAGCAARGLTSPCFGPQDHLTRAQFAALLARAMKRQTEDRGNPFLDQDGLDASLWRDVGTLAYYGLARGYDSAHFGPNDEVTIIQGIAFISRMMSIQGYWGYAADTGVYPTMTNSLHRLDLATYASHVGSVPGMSDASTAADWNAPATRDWFAAALWAALDQHFGTDHVDWAREQPTTAPSAMRDSNHRAALVAALGPIWATEQRNVTGWRRRRVAGNVPG